MEESDQLTAEDREAAQSLKEDFRYSDLLPPRESSINGRHSSLSQKFDEKTCFYSLCYDTSKKRSWGWLCCIWPGFQFKSTNHYLMYQVTVWMTIACLVSIILPMIIYTFVDVLINTEVVVDSPNAPNYAMWKTNTKGTGFDKAKITMDLFYFEVQNPQEILYSRARPMVVEKGPYSYDEYYNRFDIEWSDDGDTVTYYNQKFYIFNEQRSGPGLSENDTILMPYPTVIGFKYILDAIPPQVNAFVDMELNKNLTAMEHKLQQELTALDDTIESTRLIPKRVRDALHAEIVQTNQSVTQFFDYMFTFLNQSSVPEVLFKQLMCNSPSGVSPFWKTGPSPAWFGWLNDPILLQVQTIIDRLQNSSAASSLNATLNGTIPWTSAVPGPTVNWTSEAEVRRRKNRDTFKTGKKNSRQVGLYENYQNMTAVWNCIHPSRNQNSGTYTEGKEFPACAHFQRDWTDAEATAHGYVQPFGSAYANRVEGSDCTLFGRPMTSKKVQLFLSDIYRSAFAIHTEDVSWYNGIPLRRYGIQYIDMLNASMNPNNAQYFTFGPMGLLNLTQALNLPCFASFPHFYMGDSRLVAAVGGMNPVQDIHQTVVDIEPQTGALVRAHKRLQVNYQIDSYPIPQMSTEFYNFGEQICYNVSDIVTTLIDAGVLTPGNITAYQCDTLLQSSFFQCLATPSNWQVENDRIFFPYGWVHEYVELPESEATSWNNSLFLADRIANAIRLWSLVAAGLLLAVLLTLAYSEWSQQTTKLYLEKAAHPQRQAAAAAAAPSAVVDGDVPPTALLKDEDVQSTAPLIPRV